MALDVAGSNPVTHPFQDLPGLPDSCRISCSDKDLRSEAASPCRGSLCSLLPGLAGSLSLPPGTSPGAASPLFGVRGGAEVGEGSPGVVGQRRSPLGLSQRL